MRPSYPAGEQGLHCTTCFLASSRAGALVHVRSQARQHDLRVLRAARARQAARRARAGSGCPGTTGSSDGIVELSYGHYINGGFAHTAFGDAEVAGPDAASGRYERAAISSSTSRPCPIRELYKPPDQPSGTEKPFPPLYAHRPIVIGVLWLDEMFAFQRIGVIGEHDDEPGMLADFSSFVEQRRPHLVTYNGRSFDLPVIMLRCLRHGVPLRFFFNDNDYRYRYTDAGHIDLYDFLVGARRRARRLARRRRARHRPAGQGRRRRQPGRGALQRRPDPGASRTTASWTSRRPRSCSCAIGCCRACSIATRYRRVAQGLFDALAADGRVQPVLDRIDQKRLLLAPE